MIYVLDTDPNESIPVPPEPDMAKYVLNPDRAAWQVFFKGLAIRGGIDRDQAPFQAEAHHEKRGPEFPLDKDEIAGNGRFSQPCPDMGEVIVQSLRIRRHMRPEMPYVRRRVDYILHPEGCAGIGYLGLG